MMTKDRKNLYVSVRRILELMLYILQNQVLEGEFNLESSNMDEIDQNQLQK